MTQYSLAHPKDYFNVTRRSLMHIIPWDTGITLCGRDPSRGFWDCGIEDMRLTPTEVARVMRAWCKLCWRVFQRRYPDLAAKELKEENDG